jgi:hypothetical protein
MRLGEALPERMRQLRDPNDAVETVSLGPLSKVLLQFQRVALFGWILVRPGP